jgi:large subunit ribosomal protein L28
MKRWIRIRVSAHGLRIINRRGIEAVAAELKAAGERM